jgi:peroxiredoxin
MKSKAPEKTVAEADGSERIAKAIEVIHAGHAPDGSDTNVPTTFLVDGNGDVKWLFRANQFIVRLSPDELLEAIDGVGKGK